MRWLAALVFAFTCGAQTFETAAVKVSQAGPGPPYVQAIPGNLTMQRVGFGTMFMWAYKISPHQIANADVLGTGNYDIVAKAGRPAKTDEMRVMLQALMAERFKLAMHREKKEIPAYLLVVSKSGHKLTESTAVDGEGLKPFGAGFQLTFEHATIDQLTSYLAGPLGRPVIDRTGLKGHYDFKLDLSVYGQRPEPGESHPDTVSVFQGALSKLGFKMESGKMPVEMVVIDHVEKKPVQN